ncbi:MAG: DUF4350 domain-containing protein [Verrucomicrobiota bacterium]
MLKRAHIFLLLLFILGVCLVLGLAHLFQLRYQAGDVYPQYSSLRADPLGVKAFCESLAKLPGFRVERNFQPLQRLAEARQTTLFYLGADSGELRHADLNLVKDWEAFVVGGGRLVISFFPENAEPWEPRRAQEKASSAKDQSKKAGEQSEKAEAEQDRTGKEGKTPTVPARKKPPKRPDKENKERASRSVLLQERWGVGHGYEKLAQDEQGQYEAAAAQKGDKVGLPQAILPWHSALIFNRLDKSWRVIYGRDDQQAVLIERKFGSGTIVLSSDSYLFSNEAMRQDREAELLAWLVGGNRRVIFDETHLGVREKPGVAALARKYRLQGFLAGLILLAGLFLWKSSASFVPPYDEEANAGPQDLVSGKASTAGFVNLLRRSIPAPDILAVSFDQWKSSCAHGRADLRAKIERMEAVVKEEKARPARERDPVRTYQTLSRILAERK